MKHSSFLFCHQQMKNASISTTLNQRLDNIFSDLLLLMIFLRQIGVNLQGLKLSYRICLSKSIANSFIAFHSDCVSIFAITFDALFAYGCACLNLAYVNISLHIVVKQRVVDILLLLPILHRFEDLALAFFEKVHYLPFFVFLGKVMILLLK